MTRKIEAFVVGAQKCGTTALYTFLKEHPEIQMGLRKELHLFDNDQIDWTNPPIREAMEQWYSEDIGLRMDFTPSYMYWPNSIERIAEHNSKAKIIVMLRDPIDRAYSNWKMEHGRNADSVDFGTAIRNGRNRFDKVDRIFGYVERGFYAEQLDRIYAHFPSEQILIVLQQELLDFHEDTLAKICLFLGCKPFVDCPPSQRIFNAKDQDTMLEVDRKYLEQVYRIPNQRLFEQYNLDFRRHSISTLIRPSFWIPTDFPKIDGIRNLEHGIEGSSSGTVLWFHRIVMEDLLVPYMSKITNILQRKGLPNTYLNTYGMLGKSFVSQLQRWLLQNHPDKANLPKVVMFPSDMEYPYDVPDSVICLRTSMVRYKRRPFDIAMPLPHLPWAEAFDEVEDAGIGFCGVPNHPSRQHLLTALQSQNQIPTAFIFRDRFWGRIREQSTPEEVKRLRQEYENNMRDNPFIVCSRGAGNYSIRFYETLRAGRIPILLDTEMVFPLEELIDYREFVICEATPELVLERIQEWLKTRDIQSIQRQCRSVWETYLYFPRFLEHVPMKVAQLLSIDSDSSLSL